MIRSHLRLSLYSLSALCVMISCERVSLCVQAQATDQHISNLQIKDFYYGLEVCPLYFCGILLKGHLGQVCHVWALYTYVYSTYVKVRGSLE